MASKCTLKVIHWNLCLRDTEAELRDRKQEVGGGPPKEKESLYSKPQKKARQEEAIGMVAPAISPQGGGGGGNSRMDHRTTLNSRGSLAQEQKSESPHEPKAGSLQEGWGGAPALPGYLMGAQLPFPAPTGMERTAALIFQIPERDFCLRQTARANKGQKWTGRDAMDR